MAQTVLIKKFITFLKLQKNSESLRLAKELETNPRVSGLCFGFSLCRGAMRTTGKLEWWEDVLAKITAWDERPQSLERQYVLKGAELASKDKKEPASISLETVFNRAINYIFLNHSSQVLVPYLSPPIQIDAFRKNGNFELSDGKKTLIPNKTYVATGHGILSADDLSQPATKKALEENICLLSSSGFTPHACELSYNPKTQEWSFYDPNYADNKAKIFKDTKAGMKDLLKEIKNILGADITFEYCKLGIKPETTLSETPDKKGSSLSDSLESDLPSGALDKKTVGKKVNFPPSFKHYQRLLMQNPQYVLDGWGLHALAKYAPEYLAKINPQKIKTEVTHINLPDKGGWTPLLLVATSDNIQAMEVLIQLGAKVNLVTEDKFPYKNNREKIKLAPLSIAIGYKSLNSLKTLLDHDADPNIIINGATPLSLAIKGNFEPGIALLIEKGADPNLALLHAFKEQNRSAIRKCLQLGADPNLALLCAVKAEDTSLVKTCIEHHADPQIGMITAKPLLRYKFDTVFQASLHEKLAAAKALPLSETLKAKSPLVKALSAAYAYLGERSILKIQSRKTTELFIKNLLEISKHDLATIQQEALRFLKGEGPYRAWYGTGSSSDSRDSRLSFLYDSGLFNGLIPGQKLSAAPFSQKPAEERRLISQVLLQSKPEALTDNKDIAKHIFIEEKPKDLQDKKAAFDIERSKSFTDIQHVAEFTFLDESNILSKTDNPVFLTDNFQETTVKEKKEAKENSLVLSEPPEVPEAKDKLILLPSREKRSLSLSAIASSTGPAMFQRRYSEPSINIKLIPPLERDGSELEASKNNLILAIS